MSEYIGFDSWDDVLNHITSGKVIYYEGPFDMRPSRIECFVKNNNVRINAHKDYDPFTADSEHLKRFRRRK
jgi:hypothetical protein